MQLVVIITLLALVSASIIFVATSGGDLKSLTNFGYTIHCQDLVVHGQLGHARDGIQQSFFDGKNFWPGKTLRHKTRRVLDVVNLLT